MNGKELLDKMSEVDPKLIEGAYKDAEKPKSKRALFIGLGSGMAAVAAALAVVIGVKAGIANKDSVGTAVSGSNYSTAANGVDNLPTQNGNGGIENTSADKGGVDASEPGTIITQAPESVNITPEAVIDSDFSEYGNLTVISNQVYGINGMGGGQNAKVGLYYVNYWDYPKNLETFGPWSLDIESELTTLPVYLSHSTDPDADKIEARVKKSAAALGIPESELEVTGGGGINVLGGWDAMQKAMEEQGCTEEEIQAEFERLSRISAAQSSIDGTSDTAKFHHYTDGSLIIWFNTPYPKLPDGCRIDDGVSAEKMKASMEILIDEYKDFLDYENPKVGVYDGLIDDYDFYIYDDADDLATKIAQYWLQRTRFFNGSDGAANELGTIRRESMENLEKLGDYPIYTAAQALWVMQSERVPEEVRIPKDAQVLRVNLTYENRIGYTAVIPYYEFVVKTGDINEYTGEEEYGYFHIPAIPEQFLDMTIEDYGVWA